jgi:hypothetical protein
LFNDPELRSFYEQQQRIIWQLWLRTGGTSDQIAASEETLTSTGSRVARNAARIHALEKIGFDIEIITADFTTSRNQIIICNNTSRIDVTLDPNAIEEDQVHIKRVDKPVNMVGLIDGRPETLINIQYYSAHLVYTGAEWAQI